MSFTGYNLTLSKPRTRWIVINTISSALIGFNVWYYETRPTVCQLFEQSVCIHQTTEIVCCHENTRIRNL